MNLSDLTPEEQQEVVSQRLKDSKAFQESAIQSEDPILLKTLELDGIARLMGLHIEYSEEMDDNDDFLAEI